MKRYRWKLFVILLCLCFVITGCASNSTGQDTPQNAADNKDSHKEQNKTEDEEISGEPKRSADTGKYPDGSTPKLSGVKLKLTVNGKEEVIISMYDNTAVDALLKRLPLKDLSFFDLSGEEKPIEELDEPLSVEKEEPGYAPVAGEMVLYRLWGNFTFFYKDFRHSDELVPLGIIESGLDIISGQTENFTGELELLER